MTMPLYRGGAFIDDLWTTLGDDEVPAADAAVIVEFDRWKSERGVWSGRNAPTGVRIAPGVKIDDDATDLVALSLIALEFPKYTDGRAYSTAHRLRGHYGYAGELRAVGDVLLDQLQLMRRCGFDAFEITDESAIAALKRGHVAGVARFYQPGLDPDEAPAGTRPWLRTGPRA